MHFSVPYTEELVDDTGKKYAVFHIHVNGVRHSSVRFSQLYSLCEELRKEHGVSCVPQFPPKRMFQLTAKQLDERKLQLERFLQGVSSDSTLCESRLMLENLTRWRKMEEERQPQASAHLDVWLLNGQKKTLEVMNTDRTNSVLEKFAGRIQLPAEHVYFFALFLMRKEEDKNVTIVRKLQDFESPYLSLKDANDKALHRIVIRKSFFDPSVEEELIQSGDTVALNLLYIQAVADMDRSWTIVSDRAIERQLSNLQNKQSKKEYLRLARVQKFYGYIHLRPCVCNWPRNNSPVHVVAGRDEIAVQFTDANGERKEYVFSLTRIRTWRLVTPNSPSPSTENDNFSNSSRSSSISNSLPNEFHFEYLVSDGNLKWIRLRCDAADQIILLSSLLQAMVEEAQSRKSGDKPSVITRPQDRDQNSSPKVNAPTSTSRISLSSLGWRSSRSAGTASSNSSGSSIAVHHASRNIAFNDAIGDDDL